MASTEILTQPLRVSDFSSIEIPDIRDLFMSVGQVCAEAVLAKKKTEREASLRKEIVLTPFGEQMEGDTADAGLSLAYSSSVMTSYEIGHLTWGRLQDGIAAAGPSSPLAFLLHGIPPAKLTDDNASTKITLNDFALTFFGVKDFQDLLDRYDEEENRKKREKQEAAEAAEESKKDLKRRGSSASLHDGAGAGGRRRSTFFASAVQSLLDSKRIAPRRRPGLFGIIDQLKDQAEAEKQLASEPPKPPVERVVSQPKVFESFLAALEAPIHAPGGLGDPHFVPANERYLAMRAGMQAVRQKQLLASRTRPKVAALSFLTAPSISREQLQPLPVDDVSLPKARPVVSPTTDNSASAKEFADHSSQPSSARSVEDHREGCAEQRTVKETLAPENPAAPLRLSTLSLSYRSGFNSLLCEEELVEESSFTFAVDRDIEVVNAISSPYISRHKRAAFQKTSRPPPKPLEEHFQERGIRKPNQSSDEDDDSNIRKDSTTILQDFDAESRDLDPWEAIYYRKLQERLDRQAKLLLSCGSAHQRVQGRSYHRTSAISNTSPMCIPEDRALLARAKVRAFEAASRLKKVQRQQTLGGRATTPSVVALNPLTLANIERDKALVERARQQALSEHRKRWSPIQRVTSDVETERAASVVRRLYPEDKIKQKFLQSPLNNKKKIGKNDNSFGVSSTLAPRRGESSLTERGDNIQWQRSVDGSSCASSISSSSSPKPNPASRRSRVSVLADPLHHRENSPSTAVVPPSLGPVATATEYALLDHHTSLYVERTVIDPHRYAIMRQRRLERGKSQPHLLEKPPELSKSISQALLHNQSMRDMLDGSQQHHQENLDLSDDEESMSKEAVVEEDPTQDPDIEEVGAATPAKKKHPRGPPRFMEEADIADYTQPIQEAGAIVRSQQKSSAQQQLGLSKQQSSTEVATTAPRTYRGVPVEEQLALWLQSAGARSKIIMNDSAGGVDLTRKSKKQLVEEGGGQLEGE